ncbi:Non-specific lipid-transfer protein [Psidium guajava]|nr:Non-specific lipid-transfer protein [Psidium guajava]
MRFTHRPNFEFLSPAIKHYLSPYLPRRRRRRRRRALIVSTKMANPGLLKTAALAVARRVHGGGQSASGRGAGVLVQPGGQHADAVRVLRAQRRGRAPACCNGIRSLYSAAKTTADRQGVCNCLKSAINGIPYNAYNAGRAAGLPGECRVNIPYKISPSTDCKRQREVREEDGAQDQNASKARTWVDVRIRGTAAATVASIDGFSSYYDSVVVAVPFWIRVSSGDTMRRVVWSRLFYAMYAEPTLYF